MSLIANAALWEVVHPVSRLENTAAPAQDCVEATQRAHDAMQLEDVHAQMVYFVLCADTLGGQCLYVAKWLGLMTAETHPKSLSYLERLTKRPAFGKVFNPA